MNYHCTVINTFLLSLWALATPVSRPQLLTCCINSEWPSPLFPTLCVWPFIGDLASDDEYLEIPSISRQRAGTYECTAVNDIDTDVQTVDITVNCESTAQAEEQKTALKWLVDLSISLFAEKKYISNYDNQRIFFYLSSKSAHNKIMSSWSLKNLKISCWAVGNCYGYFFYQGLPINILIENN